MRSEATKFASTMQQADFAERSIFGIVTFHIKEQKCLKWSIRRYETVEPILGESSRRVIYVYARITKGEAIPTYRQQPLQGKQDL